MIHAALQSKLSVCVDPAAQPINMTVLIGHLVDALYKMAVRLGPSNGKVTFTEDNSMNFDEFDLTTGQAAKRLGCSQSLIYNHMRTGKIQGRKLCGRWRCRSRDIDALLNNALPSPAPEPQPT